MAWAPRWATLTPAVVLLTLAVPARAAPFDFEQWLNDTLPHQATDLKDELKCYTLPFGAIGFASHLLTYCTVLMLGLGRSPWLLAPLRHGFFDIAFAVVGLLWTLLITVFAMVRCPGQWQFALLAFWKQAMSLTLSVTALHASILVAENAAGVRQPPGLLESNWILAAIAGNYGGVPDGNNLVLYWMYFAAKRLPLLSF
jgi:hypothetical protein